MFCSSFKMEYTVVVFPLPVGPVTNKIPDFLLIILSIFSIAPSENPKSDFVFKNEFLSKILKTIFSLYIVGIVETLISTKLP